MNVGYEWERTIDSWHARYLRAGYGVMWQLSPPTVTTGKGEFKRTRAISIGPLDFMGHIDGLPCTFDAKATQKNRWGFTELVSHPKGKPRNAHQARQLDLWQQTGGFSGLLLRFEAPWGPGYLVPWWTLQDLWWTWYRAGKGGRQTASIDVGWCDEHAYRINMHEGYRPLIARALEER